MKYKTAAKHLKCNRLKNRNIRLFLILSIGILIYSCSSYSELKKFKGQKYTNLIKKFGEPKTIIPRDNDSLYIYQKSTELNRTVISQGKLALDPMVSPGATKIERYTFLIKNGLISEVKKEVDYER